jgi:hypothetical protein
MMILREELYKDDDVARRVCTVLHSGERRERARKGGYKE